VSAEEYEDIIEARARATEAIVESDAVKKLIVAGPGPGKSFSSPRWHAICSLRFSRDLHL
jgi:hypothetical protein